MKVEEPIAFEPDPLCVFTEFERTYKTINLAPKHNRGTQSILIYLVKRYGNSIIQEAHNLATEQDAQLILERKLLNALYLDYRFQKIGKFEGLKTLAKSVVRYCLYQDPFKEILIS